MELKTVADCVAYILIYASGYDNHIADEEVSSARGILYTLMDHFGMDQDGDGDVDVEDLNIAFTRASETYSNADDGDAQAKYFLNCCLLVKEKLNEGDMKIFAGKLRELMEADGTVAASEERLLDVVNDIANA